MTMSATSQDIGSLRLLTLLLAHLPSDRVYTAEPAKWTEAIKNLRDEFDDEYPELFADLTFLVRGGTPTYSPQISEFLTMAQFGDLVEVMNPKYARLRLHQHAQDIVRQELQKQLPTDVCEVVGRLATHLARESGSLIVEPV